MFPSMTRKRPLVKFSDLITRNFYWITVGWIHPPAITTTGLLRMITLGPIGSASAAARTPGRWVTALISLTVGVGNDGRCEPWRGVGSSRGTSGMSGMT